MDYFLTPYKKINRKCIKDLQVRPETIKLLEENTGSRLFNISLSNIFLDVSPQAREIRTKINKRDHIKLQSYCTTKKTINQMKRLPTEWEKICANNVSGKGLISHIYKGLIQPNIKKASNPITKWAEDLKRHFSKKDLHMAKRHMKRCSI